MQEEHGTSLEEQVEKGRLYATVHDYTVCPEHRYSGDESGTRPLGQRPIIQCVFPRCSGTPVPPRIKESAPDSRVDCQGR